MTEAFLTFFYLDLNKRRYVRDCELYTYLTRHPNPILSIFNLPMFDQWKNVNEVVGKKSLDSKLDTKCSPVWLIVLFWTR